LPYFLSGGLSSDNNGEITALKGMNLHALDFKQWSGGVPGFKEPFKLKAVFDTVGKIRLKNAR
jgi:hypothetical protein